ncbi:DUF4442 domain-containing protein [bacterium]|nr:MAG: DUF4442 domain-containing protein [bacterium]
MTLIIQKINVFRWINWYPPFLGAGIRVKEVDRKEKIIEVEMKLRFWNRNYVGTHYGGSLYSMCDPFFMLILMRKLGKDYIVWDKSAQIKFVKPGSGKVKARFHVPDEKIQSIKEELEAKKKADYEFEVSVTDEQNNIVAEVKKLIYVRKRGQNATI